jgi:AraC family transcriptional regulator
MARSTFAKRRNHAAKAAMAAHFRHLRAQYYDDDPAGARGLRHYHVREQEMAGLLGTETRHPPLFRIPRHAHDLPSFYVVLEGDLTEYSERRESRLPTSSVVFTPPGEIHSNAFHGSGGRCFLVEFTSRWTDQLGASGAMLHRPLAAAAGELAPLAIRVYQEFRDPDRMSPLAVEGLTLEILAAFARQWEDRPDLRAPGWLRNARDLVHDRFTETMTAGTIAGAVGVHPVRLVRAFRRHFRCSLAEYQRRLRVEHASRLLAATGRTLADIALSAGFADQAHFSRVFKQHTGLTPARFRSRFAVR